VILDLVRHGMSRTEIAARRGISRDAVRYHVRNIGSKLGVSGGVTRLRHWPGIPDTSPLHPTKPRKDRSMTTASELALGPIAQVSLSIRDVSRAERFYGEALGLPHVFTFGDLAFFDAGGVRLYLHCKDEDAWQPGSTLYFLVDDIHAAQEELSRRGAHFTSAPHVIYTDDASGTEEWMTFFDDGEGNTLALMSRVQTADPAR
jgi:predicted enzyme related to lactoylglutathione lyase